MVRARQLCPNVYVYIKPITGRPPAVIPYLEDSYWKSYPKARAADLARFLANGALVRALQALGVDVTAGTRAAIDSLRAERTIP